MLAHYPAHTATNYVRSSFGRNHSLSVSDVWAMCATAFFAILRIGEITATSQNSETLHLNQLGKLTDNLGIVISYVPTFQDFKHHYIQRPLSITLTRHPGACPVRALLDYISVRGTAAGPLFQTSDGSPVLRSVFSDLLS